MDDTDSTEFKLALLSSQFPERQADVLLDYLLAYDGNVTKATEALEGKQNSAKRKRSTAIGYQSSLYQFVGGNLGNTGPSPKQLTKKGKTLHLYSPHDIEQHTPCSIIHNFLPPDEGDALLRELLAEATSFRKDVFQLFDRTVESPHTSRFYVDNRDDVEKQYVYAGSYVSDVAQTTPEMLRVSGVVRRAVNREIKRRVRDFFPGGRKLKFQADPETSKWKPNVSFVNCYDGASQSVGYHTDQLTYLGPCCTIGSLSLGVSREFRLKKIHAENLDESGQIAIHLPHNSLLIMHARCQEEWKHSIAPTRSIDPHPIAGNKRLNVQSIPPAPGKTTYTDAQHQITYRFFKEFLQPMYTPRCKCGYPAILRCVQKQTATRDRYCWMCYRNYSPGESGCAYFHWAEIDEDGRFPWTEGYTRNANDPSGCIDASPTDMTITQLPT